MAGPAAAVAEAWDKVAAFVYAQLYDEKKRAKNYKTAKAIGVFAASVLFMRTFGDMIAI